MSLFPPKPQILRPYQDDGLGRTRAALRRLIAESRPPRVLLVAPTGAGKTTIAAEMIRGAIARDGDVLFLAHRKELIDQCSQRLDGVGVAHGIIQAKHPRNEPWARVQVASVQTLARRLDDLPRASLVIVDEAHHARAATYSHILDRYPDTAVVGLTATPWRLDNRGLGELFEDLVVAARPRELIQQGHLVPYTGFAYDTPDLAKVHKVGADYKSDELGRVMGSGKLAGNIVEQWQQHCRNSDGTGKRTVVFAVNVAHSMDLLKRFRDAGVSAEHVDGTSPVAEREGVLRRLARNETQVVCNVNVLTEGWDCPELEVVVLARPTLSVGFYMQMVGRGLRPAPGKSLCRIHDHAGCILRHGLPDQDRDYSLSTDARRPLATDPSQALRRCTTCFALYAADLKACPQCGAPPVVKPRVIREVEGVGVPIEELANDARLRKAYLDEQLRIAEKSGRKRGWAAYRYKERFGEWPPSHFWAGGMKQLDGERIRELNDKLRQHLGGAKR